MFGSLDWTVFTAQAKCYLMLRMREDMSVEEAIELVDKCILEIRSRLVVAPPNFVIKIVDKDGARDYAWRQSVQDVTTAAV
ncbi:unnamed protein product [Eruca vesicaria subsp. sativa]|uniref:Uncharacterized protein n=1 Tax=Eruca vesicaria subsp. sativa TaxID=29727 RepID=A0ABC8LX83_ERUVS|nr:unnamed protein product [Eruca vesicaria subsp. sativa]